MLKPRRSSKTGLWVLVWLLLTTAVFVALVVSEKSAQKSALVMPNGTAHEMQQELDGGWDPDSVLGLAFNVSGAGSVKELSKQPPGFRFGIIAEQKRSYIKMPYITSSAVLNGLVQLPSPDQLSYTKQHGSNQFIWRPTKDLAIATQMLTYNYGDVSGYIIVGQDLKPSENYLLQHKQAAIISWAILTVAILVLCVPHSRKKSKENKRKR